MQIAAVVFPDFELLDLAGPVEALGFLDGVSLAYVSVAGGPVRARQGLVIDTKPWSTVPEGAVLLIPGGPGTRPLSLDAAWVAALDALVARAGTVLTVCTG